MRIAKFLTPGDPIPMVGLVEGTRVRPLDSGPDALSRLLAEEDVEGRIGVLLERGAPAVDAGSLHWLAPIDAHEVWGAGVTYERSKVARQEESEQGGSFYDLVYRAERPELFFKATPNRVSGPGEPVRVRRDTAWSVPEPELALVLTPALRLVGFTIGNDMSARDIEGENPLYLPQAKLYDACCALGPVITLASALPTPASVGIRLIIERGGSIAFEGATSVGRMARRLEDLIDWLGRDNVFPNGVVLLTGTGIVPPDEFSLRGGDVVRIEVDGIGTLSNPVIQGPPPRSEPGREPGPQNERK